MKIATHNGKFHSDDVFGVALLTSLFPDAEIVRSRDQAVLDACDIVLDVGGSYDPDKERFDHHMPGGAGTRPNGILYSAFGLIWQKYGAEFCGDKEVAERLFEGFVSSFDAYDNGQTTYKITTPDARVVQLQDLFDKYLNPNTDESSELEDYDREFMKSVELAKLILDRVVKRKKAEVRSERLFYDQWQASPDKRYVVLDQYATAGDIAEQMPELLYYVYQSPAKDWRVQGMRVSKESYDTKKPLPAAWAGLKDEEFKKVSGVADARFCHNALYLCGAESKEGAIKLLQIALG